MTALTRVCARHRYTVAWLTLVATALLVLVLAGIAT